MTFPERMLYGGGLRDGAVPLWLVDYPPVMTCFRSFLVSLERMVASDATAAM